MPRFLNKSFLVFLTVVLFGCGGGVANNNSLQIPAPSNSGNVITPDNSAAPALDTNSFLTLANNSYCNNLQNRLFLIDKQFVLWDKIGSCADAAYQLSLFDRTPQTILCRSEDSIAGPRSTCKNPKNDAIFKTITSNLDKVDLGLGRDHQVQMIAGVNVSPNLSSNIPFTQLNGQLFHGPTAETVIIKDKLAWNAFKAAGSLNSATITEPNFETSMVLGTFFNAYRGCNKTQILQLTSNGQKVLAQYADWETVPLSLCDLAPIVFPYDWPMNLVLTQKLDLPIEFKKINNQIIAPISKYSSQLSGVQTTKNLVVKDQTSWEQLWADHSNKASAAPNVDFTKNMVLAIFLGQKTSGCFRIGDTIVWQTTDEINVSYQDIGPAPGDFCTMNMTNPAYLVTVPRSDLPANFIPIRINY